MQKGTLFRGLALLSLVWAIVWGVMTWTGKNKATTEKVVELIEENQFEDWSKAEQAERSEARKKERMEQLMELRGTLRKLDNREFENLGGMKDIPSLFARLSPEERVFFVDFYVKERSEGFMSALDEMEPDERRKQLDMVKIEFERMENQDALANLIADNPGLLDEIVDKGVTSFYQSASPETKMQLAAFLAQVGKVVQGFAKPGGGGL